MSKNSKLIRDEERFQILLSLSHVLKTFVNVLIMTVNWLIPGRKAKDSVLLMSKSYYISEKIQLNLIYFITYEF